MMAMARGTPILLGFVILFSSATAFAGHKYATQSRAASTLPRRPSLGGSPLQLRAEPSPADDAPRDGEDQNAAAPPASQYDDGDPRQALEQFGSLFSQVQDILTEGGSWDSERLEEKTRDFVTTYIRVFVPGVGYAATSLAVFASSFLFCLSALALSGRGYADLVAAADGVAPLRDLLARADPAWGNAALALLGCELLSPAILALTLALTPATTEALRQQLGRWGWGEEDIDRRVAEILNSTS